jgi:hypothetical protein
MMKSKANKKNLKAWRASGCLALVSVAALDVEVNLLYVRQGGHHFLRRAPLQK